MSLFSIHDLLFTSPVLCGPQCRQVQLLWDLVCNGWLMPSALLCNFPWNLDKVVQMSYLGSIQNHHYFKNIRQGSMGMMANTSNSTIWTHFLYDSWLSSILEPFDQPIITQSSQVYQAFMLFSQCSVIKKSLTFLAVPENFKYWISLHWVNWVIFLSLCGQKGKHIDFLGLSNMLMFRARGLIVNDSKI